MYKLYRIHDRDGETTAQQLTDSPDYRYDVVDEEITRPEDIDLQELAYWIDGQHENSNRSELVGAAVKLVQIMNSVGVPFVQIGQVLWHIAAAGGLDELRDYEVQHADQPG